MSLVTSELPAKRLELLKEIMPKLTRLTILGDISREVEVQERFSAERMVDCTIQVYEDVLEKRRSR